MAFTTIDLSTRYDLSKNGTLTVGTCLLGGFKSGSLTIESDTNDNSTRDDQGWAAEAPSSRSASLEVTYNKLATDAAQVGIRGLILDNDYVTKGVQIVYRSENASTSAGTGFKGTFCLTNYSESQEKGGEAVECTATFTGYGAIVADNAAQSTGGGGTT